MKARNQKMNQYNQWLSLASLSLLSAAALQVADAPTVLAEANPASASNGWVQEGQSFKTLDEAMNYGSQHADWSKYKQYRVNYAGPNRFVLKWELKDAPTPGKVSEPASQAGQSSEKPVETTKPAENTAVNGSYTVQAGDSLWRISKKHGVSIQDLMTWNKLGANYMLHPGDKLVVQAPAKAERPSEKPTESEKPVESTTSKASYTVQSGDSLWRISHKYGVSIQDLMTWNKLGSDYMLHPGDKLVVQAPAKAERPSEKPAEDEKPTQTTKPAESPSSSYTVQSGDSLWRISNKYGVSIQDLMTWNKLGTNYMLHPGDKLVVKAPAKAETPAEKPNAEKPTETTKPAESTGSSSSYTVQSGDSLWRISKKYFVSIQDLMTWNKLGANYMLHPGDKLVVKAPAKADTPSEKPSKAETTKPAPTSVVKDGWVEEDQSFKTADEAMTYGSQHADWSKYKQYRVDSDGSGRYVLKWKLRTPQASPKKQSQAVKVNTKHGFVREPRRFSSIQEALNYGNSVFNWRKYKMFYVNYAGPNSYILDWELREK
ncbi:LysM peptidoglycan-binding domain-containing protein [Aerococcus urinae]|uniref:muramidase family protein n=1 Tax=Aerococcus urinae TaxID=1376 RepID=UPI00227D4981|nr:LysM peptidoglycan-binding domain-containing protein [Aerococcus urinae]MCY3051882.1 LysM peptidoglycan-binding domain-containing protein [Aerococcus urinae]